jgi:hypothetical protein
LRSLCFPDIASVRWRPGGEPGKSRAHKVSASSAITWATGLGCSLFGAEIKGTRLIPIGDQVQFVVEIRKR